MPNAARFRSHDVPMQRGEKARLKVVSGPDKGSVYVITGSPVGIGRGETCDVVLSDLKSSRLHADLSFVGVGWQVRDLGSSNGVRHNGKEAKVSNVVSGDTVAVGETILEFVGIEVGAKALVAAPRSPQAVRQDHMAVLSQQERIKAITSFGGLGKSAAPAAAGPDSFGSDPQKVRKMILLGLAALLVTMMMLPEQVQKVAKGKDKKDKDKLETQTRDLASYLPKGQSSEVVKQVQTFFRAGFREYREGNYLRAKSQFETVLQIDPSHKLATIYLQNAEKSIQEAVSLHLSQGKKDFSAGKVKSAKGHYEAVLRLLYKDQANPFFAEAKEQLDKIKLTLREED